MLAVRSRDSRAHGAGTGTVFRAETVRRYADDADFSTCEMLPIEDDFWRFYLLRLERVLFLGYRDTTSGISTFDLSRYMGTSLAMIDRHYGHLARDGREHAIRLLDIYKLPNPPTSTRRTLGGHPASPDANADNGKGR